MTKQQVLRLARQLPPHDADARHCHGPLSDDEKKRLEQFRDVRYRTALGQGTVQQLDRKTFCRQVAHTRALYLDTNVTFRLLSRSRLNKPRYESCSSVHLFVCPSRTGSKLKHKVQAN